MYKVFILITIVFLQGFSFLRSNNKCAVYCMQAKHLCKTAPSVFGSTLIAIPKLRIFSSNQTFLLKCYFSYCLLFYKIKYTQIYIQWFYRTKEINIILFPWNVIFLSAIILAQLNRYQSNPFNYSHLQSHTNAKLIIISRDT